MNYISELRKQVGTRPLIMVGASLLALNDKDQILMVKRTDNQCWGIPGGAMELGETIEETLKRETLEEIGVKLEGFQLFGVYSGNDLYYQYPDGSEVYNVSIVYITRLRGHQIILNPKEHSDFGYFELSDLPVEISPPIKPFLKDLHDASQLTGNKPFYHE